MSQAHFVNIRNLQIHSHTHTHSHAYFTATMSLSAPSEVKLFFLPEIIPISVRIKMSDFQTYTTKLRFQPSHSCHQYNIVINSKI